MNREQLQEVIKVLRYPLALLRAVAAHLSFPGSGDYWERRYQRGRASGAGSYGRLSIFKADIINALVEHLKVESVIEFGCGDGHQLSLARYPRYIGLDVAPKAIEVCKERFRNDDTKQFFLYRPQSRPNDPQGCIADLSLSLDVIYHLVEDQVFNDYMRNIFAAAKRVVVVYSSNREENCLVPHVRQRKFTDWIDANVPHWSLMHMVKNPYPYDPHNANETSISDFYIYMRVSGDAGKTVHNTVKDLSFCDGHPLTMGKSPSM